MHKNPSEISAINRRSAAQALSLRAVPGCNTRAHSVAHAQPGGRWHSYAREMHELPHGFPTEHILQQPGGLRDDLASAEWACNPEISANAMNSAPAAIHFFMSAPPCYFRVRVGRGMNRTGVSCPLSPVNKLTFGQVVQLFNRVESAPLRWWGITKVPLPRKCVTDRRITSAPALAI